MLPLFSAAAYGWTREPNLVAELRQITAMRARYQEIVTDAAAESIRPVETGNPAVIGFVRGCGGRQRLLILANSDMKYAQRTQVIPATAEDEASRAAKVDGEPEITLAPGQVAVVELA